ncbi:MAG: hypothetical protein L0Y71_19725 [Gemmataceae bacterium]|nr:hypothetical protein [Gemmataceae bacterium]
MATITLPDDQLKQTLDACVPALRMLATYELDPMLARRMQEMGERKEFLTPEEHAELLALVRFSQQRTIEKLQAGLALNQLRATFPDFVGAL